MGKLSGPRTFFSVEWGAKVCADAEIKAIGVKTTVITSDIFAIGVFNLKKKKKKREQMEGLVVFCQKV